jgi:two-component system OmpR family response regulator
LTRVSRILVADDEAHIREVVRYTLERDGYEVDTAVDGVDALARIEAGGIDLVVLDVLMPSLDGLSLCRRLRARSRLPIIVLSSRAEEADRIVGLDLGADDYVTKPFSPGELAARVRSVLRRSDAREVEPAPPVLRHGRVEVDRARHEVRVDGAAIAVTVTELRLLAALVERPGRALTRGQLIAIVYDGDHHITTRTIDTHVRNLRAKLQQAAERSDAVAAGDHVPRGIDVIETVHGMGYRAR